MPPTHAWGLVEGVEPGRMDKDEYTKERCFMTQLQIVYLLRPGTQERWRRLCQEVAGSRKEQFEASCRHMGITQVQVRLVQLLHGDLMLITLHTQEPHQTLQELVTAERPFERWLRAQLQGLLGWNVQDVLPDLQGDLIFISRRCREHFY
jgi:hypothetical protein